ncbi:hypothetical protein [Rhizobium rhizosphaerae]|uniref:hypothetical protein n=1 Tax=Xaviernesmea rhizosphaerae TaxID=1672749 RepID=UPI00117A74D6|nr:hypothetical protein [Xaviernesmea rhizosphaerae]
MSVESLWRRAGACGLLVSWIRADRTSRPVLGAAGKARSAALTMAHDMRPEFHTNRAKINGLSAGFQRIS